MARFVIEGEIVEPTNTGYIGPKRFKVELPKDENDPTRDMGAGELLAAGVGKSIVDAGRGIGQLVGAVSADDVRQSRELDAPLMRTGAGRIGATGGAVGMALMPGAALKGAGAMLNAPAVSAVGGALLVPRSVPAGLAAGGVTGMLQPAASLPERALNVGIGAGGGAAFPALAALGRTAQAAVDPFYEEGQRRIVGRAMRRVAGEKADDAISALRGAREIVPGSLPTAGQASGNAGIAAMERTASAIDPSVTVAYSDRMAAQNAARVAALEGVAKGPAERSAAEAAREAAARPLYDIAKGATVQADDTLKGIMGRMPKGVLDRAQDLARMNGETIQIGQDVPAQVLFVGGGTKQVAGHHGPKTVQTPGLLDASGSPMTREAEAQFSKWTGKGLHYIKMALDDAIADPQAGFVGQTRRAALGVKDDLLKWLDTSIPEYGQASQAYAAGSRPINQMDIGAEIADRSINKLTGNIQPNAYARSLSDTTAQRATGFKNATLAGTMEPDQLATLNAIRDDLQRANFAQTAGRGVGSDTAQKLAYSNFIDAAGVPTWLQALPPAQIIGGVTARAADALYGSANRNMANRLAMTMLDPAEAATSMALSQPGSNAMLRLMRNSLSPVGVSLPALVNTSQQ